jgi:dTMP kinase
MFNSYIDTSNLHPLVVIEGMDAAGKATQTHTLTAKMQNAAMLAFPQYKTLCGTAIEEHLQDVWTALGGTGDKLRDALVFQCLMTVNRLEAAPAIMQRLAKGPLVLDRYWPSGVVYGGAHGLPQEWLIRIHSTLPKPDLCMYLEIPVEESVRRRPDRRDRYERQAGLMEDVAQRYRALFEAAADLKQPWVIINGLGTQAEVAARIENAVRERFPEVL